VDRSAPAALTALLAAAALAGCGGAAPRGEVRLALVPAEWAASGPTRGDSTAVLWVFRTEDCLSCMAVDYDVRRVQARFGTAVPLIALHVGHPEQAAIPRAYFRARRLRVDRAVTLPPREFSARYPASPLPALYLLQGRRVVWSTAPRPGARAAPVRLDTLVERLRSGAGGNR
jgi:hypothetical protein